MIGAFGDILHKNSVKWWYVTTFLLYLKKIEYELGIDIRGLACFCPRVAATLPSALFNGFRYSRMERHGNVNKESLYYI